MYKLYVELFFDTGDCDHVHTYVHDTLAMGCITFIIIITVSTFKVNIHRLTHV